MSTSRENILSRLKKLSKNPLDRPERPTVGITYDDPTEQFGEMLAACGGTVAILNEPADLPQALNVAFPNVKKTAVWPEKMVDATLCLDEVEDPRSLEDLDLMICKGEFGVAENGAVWVKAPSLKYRVSLIICEHLALVIPKDQVLNNLHEAYENISFDEPGYGVFISGPSKTADIEQCLVIGAHGPKSLTVFLV
jgi:L-lactate dehydrogenase complex protein LldG